MSLYIVTGTDTGVGKTYVTSRLVCELRRRGSDAIGLKPIETGWNEPSSDAAQLAAASSRSVDATVFARFALPAAPAVAAAAEAREIDVTSLASWLRTAGREHEICLAEGAGGWMVPLHSDCLFSDLVQMLEPAGVLLVAASKLGTINHSLLTAEAISRTSPLRGIVLSVRSTDSPQDAAVHLDEIRRRVDVPVLSFPTDLPQLADLFHVEHQTR
jgi:dethiobiotin synthase